MSGTLVISLEEFLRESVMKAINSPSRVKRLLCLAGSLRANHRRSAERVIPTDLRQPKYLQEVPMGDPFYCEPAHPSLA
ncbi:hypothetical protein NDU88_001879 [Pleurodeles waltl]|uniref:Uncharacterized protein n=1 Tax=Pleurodeles waltl TaxID=8319 RepID=A0AAV7Q8B2_PLEWA|nr:hypothetical protein NDU88_001879 [Pleurodeles waltl]